jgi:hypothetical protein
MNMYTSTIVHHGNAYVKVYVYIYINKRIRNKLELCKQKSVFTASPCFLK